MLHIKKQTLEWKLPDCINIHFVGVNASKLDVVEFVERKNKLRQPGDIHKSYPERAPGMDGPMNEFSKIP